MQCGESFRIETRFLTQYLISHLKSLDVLYHGGIEFLYPTRPFCIYSAIPAGTPFSTSTPAGYAWWSHDIQENQFGELNAALEMVSIYLKENGPVDGVIRYSQGGALAIVLASLCEVQVRPERLEALSKQGTPITQQLPQSPLRFVICFSRYPGASTKYNGFYNPPIKTPSLVVSGQLDTIVSPKTTRLLIGAFDAVEYVTHYSGYYVPRSKDFLLKASEFIRRTCLRNETPSVEVKKQHLPSTRKSLVFRRLRLTQRRVWM
jgi:hypothetical protein